ncbi:hypothetical protein TCAL_16510 [Tigriopus californicus]|uniref:Uncharacterized protein n=1 Tax=Tigriopus californicus TaxID=6832 RepID=A0A553NS85_TIGCA|nr:hypothetical protein TCAL_16510 [Tigriopus californicus]
MASMGSPPSQRADGAIYHQSGPGIVPSGYPAHALPGNVPSMHHRFTGYPTQTGPSTVVQPPQHQYYQHPYTNNYHLHDPKSQISPQPPPQHAMYPQQQHFQPHQQQQQQQHQQPQGHPYSSQESNSHAIYPQNQFRPAIPHGHQHYPAYFQGPQTNPNGYQYGHPQQRAPMQPGTPVMVPNHNSMAANPMCAQQPSNGMVQAAPFTQQHMSSHMRPQMRPRVPGALQVHNYPMHSSQFQSLLTASSMNHMDSQHQHSNMRRLRQMPLGIGGPQLQQMYPQQQEQNTHSEDSQGFSHAFVESHQNQTLDQKHSEAQPFVMDSTIPSRYCAHKKLLAGLAALDKTPAFMTRIQHIHNPVISTKREAGIDNLEEPAPKESQPPINDNPRQGVSKNLEIRRMSNTEEGNKILNDAWTSPDKDKGQTPLQMVESIVSNINNLPKQESTPQLDRIHPSETTSGMAGGGVKGNSKKKALAHIAPSPSVLGQNQPNTATRALTLMQNPSLTVQAAPLSVQMSTTVQTTTSGVHHHQQQQPVMQLVNTLNGPMIMHAVPFSGANVVHAMAGSQNQLVHPILPAQAQAIPVSTSGLFSNVTKPILKKRQKKKTSEHQQPTPGNTMPIPIIMSTAPALAASPATLTAGGTQQIITIGQASQGAGMMSASHGLGQFLPHQNVMVNQAGQVVTNLGGQMIVSNGGALMTMPTVQTGMVLNQLPDGTFIQVPTTQGMISQLPILHGNCQQILANGGPIIMNSNPTGSNHQIIHSNGGTFILASPGGLVQAQGLASSLQPAGLVSPRQHQQIMLSTPGPSSGYVSPSKSNLSPNTSIKSHNTTPIELGDTSSSEDEEDDDDDDGDEDDADDNDDVEDSKDSSDSESDGIQHQSILPLKQSPSTSGLRRKSPIKLSRPTTPVKSRSPRYGTPSRSRNNSKSSSKRSTPESSKTSPRIFIQSNQVDSSGLKATPPHSACDFESPSTSSSHLHHHHERTKEVHEEDEEPSLDTSGSTDDGKGSRIKRRRKRNAEEILKEEVNLSDEARIVVLKRK